MIIKSIDDTRGYKGLPDGTKVIFDENITYIIGDNYKTKSTILSVPLWVITGYSLNEGNQEDVSDDNRPNLRNVTAQITIIDNEGEEHSIFRSKGKSNYVLLDGVKTSREALAKFYKDIQFFLCAYNPYRFRSMEKDKQKELLLRLLPNIEKEEVFSCLTEEEQNILGEPILDAKEYNKEKRVKIKEIEFEIKRNEGIKESNLLTALKVEDENDTLEEINTLKETLMADVNDRYIPRSEEDNKGTQSLDNFLKACYGAIDAEKEALSYGKIKQARRCQIQLQKYLEIMESQKYLDATKLQNYGALIIEYKRRKFAELSIGRDKNDIKETKWTEILKGCYKAEDLQRRRAISEAIRNQMREGTVKQDLYKDDEIMQ